MRVRPPRGLKRKRASMSNCTGHLRLTRRGRIVIAAVLILPVTGLIASVVASASAASAASAGGALSAVTYRHVQVEAGQSLWQLAISVAPTADPRDVVADIVRLNELPSAIVQPGQSLAIPENYRG